MPIPTRKEQVRLLSAYAAAHDGSFPARTATHPEYPEWNWGRWVNNLSTDYLDGKLKDDVRAAMDACPYWSAKLAASARIASTRRRSSRSRRGRKEERLH
jgi:hypothetical protein